MRVALKAGFSTGSTLAFLAALASAAAVASPPTIDRQWVSDVSGHDATLNAEIIPNELQTKYKLQIDTTGNFSFDQVDSCPLHPPGIICLSVIAAGDPLAPGLVQPPEFTLAAGGSSQHVSVRMSGIDAVLQPGTTYHYRAIAANGPTVIYGPDQTFSTPPLDELPGLVEATLGEGDEREPASVPPPLDPPSMGPDPGDLEPSASPPHVASRQAVGNCVRRLDRRRSVHGRRGNQGRRYKVRQRRVCARIGRARIVRR